MPWRGMNNESSRFVHDRDVVTWATEFVLEELTTDQGFPRDR